MKQKTMCEPDPDITRWGLNLLDWGYPPPNTPPPYNDPPPNDDDHTSSDDAAYYAAAEYAEAAFRTAPPSCVENDEVIAHALQEELSQLAVVEAASGGCSHDDGEASQSQASVLAQDWFGTSPAPGFCDAGNQQGWREDGDNTESATSSSSSSGLGESYYQGDGWPFGPGEDYSALDGEVGKRLNHMVPIPHVPRINGEIPSVDEATSDHQRLLDRLRLYDLVELKVQGDGNCQFRALSDQIYRTIEHHKVVRQQVTSQLKAHPEFYEGYVPMAYDEYLEKMSRDGEWGDHVTLQAAADSYGLKIFVITSFKDTCYIEILPNVQKSKRVIFLSFWAEVHYNSIYPEGDFPALEGKKKKRWYRMFGRQ